jgi:hypothetical protein
MAGRFLTSDGCAFILNKVAEGVGQKLPRIAERTRSRTTKTCLDDTRFERVAIDGR